MKHYVLFFLTVFLFSCHSKDSAEYAELSKTDEVGTEPLALTTSGNNSGSLPDIREPASYAAASAKLIRTADYRFKVNNVRNATTAIESAVAKYPAWVSASALKMEYGTVENTMTIRVQVEYFEPLLREIDPLAVHTDKREILTTDVGKEYVDLESRLKTKREVEARYMNILRKNTGTIEEILAAERQIGQIHEEIEATISRLNYLKQQITYSTIRLAFYEPVAPVALEEDPVYKQFAAAFTSGLNGSVTVLLALTHLWPMLLIGGIGYFVYRKKRFAGSGSASQ